MHLHLVSQYGMAHPFYVPARTPMHRWMMLQEQSACNTSSTRMICCQSVQYAHTDISHWSQPSLQSISKIHKYLLHPISCAYATNPLSIQSYTNIHESDALRQYMQCIRPQQIHFPCSPPSLAGVSTKSAQSSEYLWQWHNIKLLLLGWA